MFNFIYFLLFIIGTIVFFSKLTQAGTTLSLYSDRPYTSAKKFVNKQRKSDLFATIFSFLIAVNGILLSVEAACLGKYLIIENKKPLLIPILLFWILSVALSCTFVNSKIFKERVKIKKQWDTQKKITEFNDNEVRLYRQIKECGILTYKLLFLNFFNIMVFLFI